MSNDLHIESFKNALLTYIERFLNSIDKDYYEVKNITIPDNLWDIDFHIHVETGLNDWLVILQLKSELKGTQEYRGNLIFEGYEKFIGIKIFSYINNGLEIIQPDDLHKLLEDQESHYRIIKENPIEFWFGREPIDLIGSPGYSYSSITILKVFLEYLKKKDKDIYDRILILIIYHSEYSLSLAFKTNSNLGWSIFPYVSGSPGTTNHILNIIKSEVEKVKNLFPNSVRKYSITQSYSKIKDLIEKNYPSRTAGDHLLSIEEDRIMDNKEFWKSLIKHVIDHTETDLWDCKTTFDFWEISRSENKIKTDREIKAASNIASFANAQGGIIFIGISDKIPRKIVGIDNIENKYNTLLTILKKYNTNLPELLKRIEYDYSIEEPPKKILILLIPQSRKILELKVNQRDYRIPVRIGPKTDYKNFSDFKDRKFEIKENNFAFISELYRSFQL